MIYIILFIGLILLVQIAQNTMKAQPYVPRLVAPPVDSWSARATICSIERVKGSFGPCLKFFFRLEDHIEVSMIRPAIWVEGNKLDATLKSLGVALLLDSRHEPLDLDVKLKTLVGKIVTVSLEKKVSGRGKVFVNVVNIDNVRQPFN